MTSAEWCPSKRCFGLKFLMFQMMMVRSAELVASHLPSGLNVQQRTLSSCPVRVCWRDPTNSLLDEDPPMFQRLFDTTPSSYSRYQPHPHCTACRAVQSSRPNLRRAQCWRYHSYRTCQLRCMLLCVMGARGKWRRPAIDIKHTTKLAIKCQPLAFQ